MVSPPLFLLVLGGDDFSPLTPVVVVLSPSPLQCGGAFLLPPCCFLLILGGEVLARLPSALGWCRLLLLLLFRAGTALSLFPLGGAAFSLLL